MSTGDEYAVLIDEPQFICMSQKKLAEILCISESAFCQGYTKFNPGRRWPHRGISQVYGKIIRTVYNIAFGDDIPIIGQTDEQNLMDWLRELNGLFRPVYVLLKDS